MSKRPNELWSYKLHKLFVRLADWALRREQRCKAITWTNDPTRLVIRCNLKMHHNGSHLDDPNERLTA